MNNIPECPIELVFELIGNKWKVRILRDLLDGQKRFGELKKSVTGISDASIAWTPGTAFVKYGKALVTSCEISGGDGETATMSVEFTGSGALSDTPVA